MDFRVLSSTLLGWLRWLVRAARLAWLDFLSRVGLFRRFWGNSLATFFTWLGSWYVDSVITPIGKTFFDEKNDQSTITFDYGKLLQV